MLFVIARAPLFLCEYRARSEHLAKRMLAHRPLLLASTQEADQEVLESFRIPS